MSRETDYGRVENRCLAMQFLCPCATSYRETRWHRSNLFLSFFFFFLLPSSQQTPRDPIARGRTEMFPFRLQSLKMTAGRRTMSYFTLLLLLVLVAISFPNCSSGIRNFISKSSNLTLFSVRMSHLVIILKPWLDHTDIKVMTLSLCRLGVS